MGKENFTKLILSKYQLVGMGHGYFLGTSLKLIVYIPWWKHSPNLYYIKVFGISKASFPWEGATYFMLRNGFYDYGFSVEYGFSDLR